MVESERGHKVCIYQISIHVIQSDKNAKNNKIGSVQDNSHVPPFKCLSYYKLDLVSCIRQQ